MTAIIIALAILWALLAVAWWHEHTRPALDDGTYIVCDGKIVMHASGRGVTIYGGRL